MNDYKKLTLMMGPALVALGMFAVPGTIQTAHAQDDDSTENTLKPHRHEQIFLAQSHPQLTRTYNQYESITLPGSNTLVEISNFFRRRSFGKFLSSLREALFNLSCHLIDSAGRQ